MAPCAPRSPWSGAWPTIERDEWDALVGADGSPFLEWDWLDALEQSGCVGDEDRLGAAPPHGARGRPADRRGADVSQGSQPGRVRLRPHLGRGGAARRHELLPEAAGRRAAHARHRPAHPHPSRAAARGRCSDGRRPGAARHLPLERDLLRARQLLRRRRDRAAAPMPASCTARACSTTGSNHDYGAFEDYLAALRSKRRTQVRRELRDVAEAGRRRSRRYEGEAIPDDLFEPMFRIYLSTIEKLYWGRQYLNKRFFDELRRRWKRNLCFVAARQHGESSSPAPSTCRRPASSTAATGAACARCAICTSRSATTPASSTASRAA